MWGWPSSPRHASSWGCCRQLCCTHCVRLPWPLVGTVPGTATNWFGAVVVPGMNTRTALQPFVPALIIVAFAVLAAILVRPFALQRRAAPFATRVGATWNCGVALSPRMQYTASSFAQPIRRMFSAIVQPDRAQEIRYAHAPYFVEAISHDISLKPIFERWIYRPSHRVFLSVVIAVRRVQNGSIHAYLGYVFVALLVVLAVTR